LTPTITPRPGTKVCGKYTGGGEFWNRDGSPYILTCNVDVKGGLTAVGAEIELRGFTLNATSIFFRDVTMKP